MKEKKSQELARLVGKNIAARRKRKNWTQAYLGEKLGIGTDSLCRIERGVMAPRFQRLDEIASHLDCSVAELFMTPEQLAELAQIRHSSELTDISPDEIPALIAKLSERITTLSKMLA